MAYFEDFFIGNLYIIAQKTEERGLDFSNPLREWDGFVLLLTGECEFSDADTLPVPMRAGDIVLLQRGSRYRMRFTPGSSYITSALDLHVIGSALPLPAVLPVDGETVEAIGEICGRFNRRLVGDSIFCRQRLTELYLSLLLRLRSSEGESIAERAASFIRAHFTEPITPADIAAHCAVSVSYLRTKFTEKYRLSPMRWREELRIAEAVKLLQSGMFSVKEVASRLGYCDVFHFSKNFTKQIGIPPAEFSKIRR